MKIKEGFNTKETEIRIYTHSSGSIELWIKQTGLEEQKETLSYLTPDELYKLFLEVQSAGRSLFE